MLLAVAYGVGVYLRADPVPARPERPLLRYVGSRSIRLCSSRSAYGGRSTATTIRNRRSPTDCRALRAGNVRPRTVQPEHDEAFLQIGWAPVSGVDDADILQDGTAWSARWDGNACGAVVRKDSTRGRSQADRGRSAIPLHRFSRHADTAYEYRRQFVAFLKHRSVPDGRPVRRRTSIHTWGSLSYFRRICILWDVTSRSVLMRDRGIYHAAPTTLRHQPVRARNRSGFVQAARVARAPASYAASRAVDPRLP